MLHEDTDGSSERHAQLSYSGGAASADEGAAMVRGLQAPGAAVDAQLAAGRIRVFGNGRALDGAELELAASSGAQAPLAYSWKACTAGRVYARCSLAWSSGCLRWR